MTEKAKRLTPTSQTLRELFLKSGNLCAFPGCGQLMMNEGGVFVGQVCHIEAAEEGGERFNPNMSNEDRRAPANLMLMCYAHHQETNDVAKFPTEKLRSIKRDHETRFSRPDRAMLESLTDWTTINEPSEPQTLHLINAKLEWNLDEDELAESISELNDHIEVLRRVPVDLRRFLGAVASRIIRMSDTRVVREDFSGSMILASDLNSAWQLSDNTIAERTNQLTSYGLADIDQIDTDLGPKPAIRIMNLKSGWPLWLDLVNFCKKTQTPLDVFTDELDFSRLDH